MKKNLSGGDPTEAIEYFDRAIQINPRYAAAYYNRGFAYGRLGNEALAIENLRAAARLGDQDASVFLRSQGITWKGRDEVLKSQPRWASFMPRSSGIGGVLACHSSKDQGRRCRNATSAACTK